jgi:hypothetical protein
MSPFSLYSFDMKLSVKENVLLSLDSCQTKPMKTICGQNAELQRPCGSVFYTVIGDSLLKGQREVSYKLPYLHFAFAFSRILFPSLLLVLDIKV